MAPFDVKLSEHDVVEPDLIAIRADRRVLIESHHFPAPPDIALEVISLHSRRFDEVTKLKLFASSGVPEFWLADSVRFGIRGLTFQDGAYYKIPLESDGRIRSVVAPALVLDPAKLLDNLAH